MRVRDSGEQNCDLCQDDLLRHLENAREIPRGPIISSIDLPVKIGESKETRASSPRRDCPSDGRVIEIPGENKSGPRFHRDEKRPSQRGLLGVLI